MAGRSSRLVRHAKLMLSVYVLLLGATGYLLIESPKGYIPAQDRGYIIAIPQLPAGSSLERTTEIAKEVGRIALRHPRRIAPADLRRLLGCDPDDLLELCRGLCRAKALRGADEARTDRGFDSGRTHQASCSYRRR